MVVYWLLSCLFLPHFLCWCLCPNYYKLWPLKTKRGAIFKLNFSKLVQFLLPIFYWKSIIHFQARSQDQFFGGWGVCGTPKIDLLDQKSGLFEPHPLNPLTNTPFVAHFVAKGGPFGRLVGASHLYMGLLPIQNPDIWSSSNMYQFLKYIELWTKMILS